VTGLALKEQPMKLTRLLTSAGALSVAAASLTAAGSAVAASRAPALHAPARHAALSTHMALNCEYSSLCAEVANPQDVFGQYVGHDEPANVFYSHVPGSGNRNQYSLILPHDPSPSNPTTKSYQFQLNGSFWFGMALCDTQSYPEQNSTCTPDSDSNILDPAVSPNHAGSAFLEMQFYPPGWIPWPTWAVATGASTCDPTKWCAALNIDSLSEDPVNGTVQNSTCASKVGLEYVNFAFITKNGHSQAPPNPVDSTLATFTPDPSKDLFMNSGDHLQVTSHDTPNGLKIAINDLTTGHSGSMTASAANGFAQIGYDPTGTSCQAIPYNFHPMYSTSSPQTRVIWAAHAFNVGFSTEIGHFENCTGPTPVPASPFGLDSQGNPITCPAGNFEGIAGATPTDGDDAFCFPGSEALLVHVTGCTATNTGFDSFDYQPVWPDGNTALHPQSILFSSPLTGHSYHVNYKSSAFEADLPRLEGGTCRATGSGCLLFPLTDSGQPAAFYPFYSAFQEQRGNSHGCMWGFGNALPGANNFGRNAQYGPPISNNYLQFGGGGSSVAFFNDFRQVLANPCRSHGQG
jgi:hypothetical protein